MQAERMQHRRRQTASEVMVDHFLRKEELRTASRDDPERWESLSYEDQAEKTGWNETRRWE